MEEAQTEKQAFEHLGLRAAFEELGVADRIHNVGAGQIRAQAFWGLVGHLHAALQDGGRELFGGVGGQPQAEVGVRLRGVWGQLLAYLLERGQPGHGQVAVLQHRPVPGLLAVHDYLGREGPLALAQRNRVHGLALLLREHVQRGKRVGARREDEDEGGDRGGLLVDFGQVEGRGVDELLAQALGHEILDRRDQLVGPQRAQNQEFVEGGELLADGRGQGLRLGVGRVVYLLPLREHGLEGLVQSLEAGEAGEPVYFAPGLGGDPGAPGGVREFVVQGQAAGQQEPEVGGVHLALEFEQARAEQEGEEQLVLLEERAADVLVEGELEVGAQVGQPLFEHLAALALDDGLREEVDLVGQRVLVHGVDVGQVGDDEEQAGGLLRDGLVELAGRVDVLFGYLRDFLLLLDFVRFHLRGREHVDCLLVGEDVLGVGEHLEDLFLDFEQLFLVVCALDDESLLLLLEFRALLLDQDAQKLVVQALLGDHEVDQGHLGRNFGQVVGVAQLGGHVEGELRVVLDGLVAQLDLEGVSLLLGLLQEHGGQRGVEFLAHVLEEHGLAELDCVFQRAHEVRVGLLHDLQLPGLLHALDPLVGLALGVDAQRPASGLEYDYGVFGGEGVGGQAVDVPGADLHRVSQHLLQREGLLDGDGEFDAPGHPLLGDLRAERARERAQVGNHAGRDQDVAGQLRVVLLQLLCELAPAVFFAAQVFDELLGAGELVRALFLLLFEALLVALGLLQIAVEGVHLVVGDFQFLLLLRELRVQQVRLALRGLERLLLGLDLLVHEVEVVDAVDPHEQPGEHLDGLVDGLHLEAAGVVGALQEGAEVGDGLLLQLVDVELEQLGQQARLVHDLDGGRPPVGLVAQGLHVLLLFGGVGVDHQAEGLQHLLDDVRGALQRPDFVQVLLLQVLERVLGGPERGHGLLQVLFALLLYGGGLVHRHLHHGLLLPDVLLQDVRLALLLRDLLDLQLGVLRGLFELRLQVYQVLLHALHRLLRDDDLLVAVLVLVYRGLGLLALFGQQRFEGYDQLQVGGGRDVVLPPQLVPELVGPDRGGLVEVLHRLDAGVAQRLGHFD